MKLKEYLQKITAMIDKDPRILELEVITAIEIWIDSYQWPIDVQADAAPFLTELLRKYYESSERTTLLDAKLNESLANLSLIRSRICELNENLGIDLHAQIREIASRQNRDQSPTEPIPFLDARLYYANPSDLLVLFHEIALTESDQFESELEKPFIIDGGANIGMAIAYFKWLHPHSKIIAFEPNPLLHDICQRNIVLNQWRDTHLYPYALSTQPGSITFYCDNEMPMASSSLNRAEEEGRS